MRSSNLSNIGAHAARSCPQQGVQLMTSLYAVPTAHYQARRADQHAGTILSQRGREAMAPGIERLVTLRHAVRRSRIRRRNMIPPKALP